MRNQVHQVQFDEYDHLHELSKTRADLVARAVEAAERAYAPYSGYNVGAAVLLANGRFYSGNNQENAAYPSGLCAERVVLFYAGSQCPGVPVTHIAIAAVKSGIVQPNPVSPCGGCRQVMYETEFTGNQSLEVILYGKEKILVIHRAADLLPLPFILKEDN